MNSEEIMYLIGCQKNRVLLRWVFKTRTWI